MTEWLPPHPPLYAGINSSAIGMEELNSSGVGDIVWVDLIDTPMPIVGVFGGYNAYGEAGRPDCYVARERRILKLPREKRVGVVREIS